MKFIDSISKLPKWFNLEYYEKYRAFSPADLYSEIEGRAVFMEFLNGGANEYGFSESKLKERYKFSPIVFLDSWNDYTDYSSCVPSRYSEAYERLVKIVNDNNSTPRIFGGVKLINLGIFAGVNELIDGALSDYRSELSNNELRSIYDDFNFEMLLDVMDENEIFIANLMIEVDTVNYDDEDLIDNFKNMLNAYRQAKKIQEPKYKKAKLSEIQKVNHYKLMAISDLKFWEVLFDCKIKQSVLDRALFPDGSCGENRLKQVILKSYNKIFSLEYFQRRIKLD